MGLLNFPKRIVTLAETPESVNEIIEKILTGCETIMPWLGSILAIAALMVTIFKVIQFVQAKNSGNDQGAEQAKKGMIWGIVAVVVLASLTLVLSFALDIAEAFGYVPPVTGA